MLSHCLLSESISDSKITILNYYQITVTWLNVNTTIGFVSDCVSEISVLTLLALIPAVAVYVKSC